jgi:hypothetical protein
LQLATVNPICAGISGGGPQQHSNRRGDQESGRQRWGAHGNQSQQSQVHLTLQVGGSLQVRKTTVELIMQKLSQNSKTVAHVPRLFYDLLCK